MTLVKRTVGTLCVVLMTLAALIIGPSAAAAGDPGLGTHPGSGSLVHADLPVNQTQMRTASLAALSSIRAQMYDDAAVVLDGKPLKQVVSDAGLTRSQYVNGVTWDTDLERSALQRAYEQNLLWGHVRPDGGSYANASVGVRWPGEIITTQADISTAISDVKNGTWAGERDALINANGAFNNDTGHLYNLINPKYTAYAFARVGGVSVGWMSGTRTGTSAGTQLNGTYQFSAAVSDSVLTKVNGRLTVPSSMDPGQTAVASVTGTARAQSWASSIPVTVAATITSSNPRVVSVSSNGTLTAVSGGTAAITARTATGKTFTANVSVTGPVASSVVSLSNSWSTLAADVEFAFGAIGDEVIVGDWNGDGVDTVGIRRGTTFSLYDSFGGTPTYQFNYGRLGDEVVIGDWNGDGADTLGVRRGNTFYLNDVLRGGTAEHQFDYGRVADEVLIGNWDGVGADTISVRRETTFYINNRLIGGYAEREFRYGRLGDEAIVGDFNGDRMDTVTLRRSNVLHINNQHAGGNAERSVAYGIAGEPILIGDWNGDGIDTPGLFRVK